MSKKKRAAKAPETREIQLTPEQAKAFNAAVQRTTALRAQFEQAAQAQSLAVTMLGASPERVVGWDSETRVLTVTEAAEPEEETE